MNICIKAFSPFSNNHFSPSFFFFIGKKQYIDEKREGTNKYQLPLTYTPSKSKTPPTNLSYQHYTT